MLSRFFEYIRLALRNIRGNLLRTILTCLIIALGIMALVGIQTVIGSLGNQLGDVFSPFGTNQFTISNRSSTFDEDNSKPNPPISIKEAKEFKSLMTFPSRIGISTTVSTDQEIKTQSAKTNPTFDIYAGDEYYLDLNSHEIETGRNFSFNELSNGENVVIITPSLKKKLFEGYTDEQVLEKMITARGVRYRIVGILKDKGQGFGRTSSFILIPLENAVRFFGTPRTNYQIKVGVITEEAIKPAMEESRGIMRIARDLNTTEQANFEIEEPGAANDELKAALLNVTMGGLLIGVITLAGAAVGLMNILLVSVTERVREIGISKAIGGTVGSIRAQYFIEGMVISLIGGLLGILFGLAIGLVVAKLLKTVFVIPWLWVIVGIGVCLIVGLVSSIYPAIKASRLNPIEALRQS